jgi:hypothetical protein
MGARVTTTWAASAVVACSAITAAEAVDAIRSDVCARNRRRTADLIGTPEGMRPHQTRDDRILI